MYFYSPLINGKTEDRVCGYGPRLGFYLRGDDELENRKRRVYELISLNFESVFKYIKRFDYMQVFFTNDFNKTKAQVEDERCKYVFTYSNTI